MLLIKILIIKDFIFKIMYILNFKSNKTNIFNIIAIMTDVKYDIIFMIYILSKINIFIIMKIIKSLN